MAYGASGRSVARKAVPADPNISTRAGPNIAQHVVHVSAPNTWMVAEIAVAPKTREDGLV